VGRRVASFPSIAAMTMMRIRSLLEGHYYISTISTADWTESSISIIASMTDNLMGFKSKPLCGVFFWNEGFFPLGLGFRLARLLCHQHFTGVFDHVQIEPPWIILQHGVRSFVD
jgi:hypothetical protein